MWLQWHFIWVLGWIVAPLSKQATNPLSKQTRKAAKHLTLLHTWLKVFNARHGNQPYGPLALAC
jgi:hypothetical protein